MKQSAIASRLGLDPQEWEKTIEATRQRQANPTPHYKVIGVVNDAEVIRIYNSRIPFAKMPLRALDKAITASPVVRHLVGHVLEFTTYRTVARKVKRAARPEDTPLALKYAKERSRARWHHYRKQTRCAVCDLRPRDLADFTQHPAVSGGFLCQDCLTVTGVIMSDFELNTLEGKLPLDQLARISRNLRPGQQPFKRRA